MKWLKRRKPVAQSTTSTAMPRTTLMMPLEQRLMFDGALVVTAADAVTAGRGRFGMILWVKPKDVGRAAKALGAR